MKAIAILAVTIIGLGRASPQPTPTDMTMAQKTELQRIMSGSEKHSRAWGRDWIFDDHGYTLWINSEILKNTPIWNIERAPNPPLPMRRAIAHAT